MMYDTIREAAAAWVDSFNAVPVKVIEKLMRLGPDEVREITPCDPDEYLDPLPMWRVMWSFGDPADKRWLKEENGLELMAKCGFRIYEQEDFGYLFGIDGAGYNFMEAHWLPLYKVRGLHWHRRINSCRMTEGWYRKEEPAPKGGGLVQKILEGRA